MARHGRDYTGERYSAQIRVQTTPSQRAALRREAAARDLPLSALVRAKLTGGRVPEAGRDPAAIRALTAQLARIGNNLNQLAHHANQAGRIRSEAAIEAVTARIIDTLDKVVGG
jgi:hypothetical protein